MQAASLQPTNTSSDEVDEEIITENVINEAESESTIINEDGTIKDYTSEINEKIIAAEAIEDEYDRNITKSQLTADLISDIEKEVDVRNEQLQIADEEEKSGLEEKISELKNDKVEQQIAYNEYVKAARAAKNKKAEESLTANNLNAKEDEFSNLKYNNKFEYKSSQSVNDLAFVQSLKEEAEELKKNSEETLNNAISESNEAKKKEGIEASKELAKSSEAKQLEIAKVYENANRSEFYNNESVLSNLKKENKDPYSDKSLLAEMAEEESNMFYDLAKEEREESDYY